MEAATGLQMNRNECHFPTELAELVASAVYRPGWSLTLRDGLDRGQGSKGLTLDVVSLGYDTYNVDRGENYRVHHYFPVPPAAFNRRSWRRWILDCLLEIESHETCEFLQLDGERPFAPNHGPGCDPYTVVEYATDEERRTDFRGQLQEDS